VTSFRSSTSPGPLTPDTQPGSLPSQPNVGLWSDSDVGLPQGPAAAFVTNQASASETEMPTIGHIGRYALKYRIGAGGLGTVYAAHDPLLSRLVAIKTLSLELSADERESFNTLFLDEARAAGGLSHPHIVTVFDAGVSDNSAYIAMEMLKGRDLRQLRQEGWRPSPAQAALIVRRVADALAYAHSKGVVHRDIKPANIFMVGRTQPRVLDFGIARVAHRHEIGSAGDIAAGSPYYMAPEQARHQTVDRRADVFSLGVVLYELLADRKPFRGTTLAEITNAVLTQEPPLACEVDRKVPLGLAEIAARAMLKDPEQRYRSARAFSRDLRHWLDDNAGSQEGDAPVPASTKSRRRWVAGALAGVAVGGVVLAVALAPRQKAEPSATTATNAAATDAAARAATPAPVTRVATPAPAPTVAAAPTAAAPPTTASSAAAQAVLTTPAATGAAATATATAAGATPASAPVAGASAPTPPAAAAPPTPPAAAPPAPAVAKKPPAPAPKPAAKPPATAKAAPAKPPVNARAAPASPRRTTEVREPEPRTAAAVAAAPAPVAAKTTGTLRIAISPWGQVEVDGVPAGTTPPLNELTLPEGKHQIIIRNGDFPPFRATVTVNPGQAVSIKHKFGS
jgi:eukaryotic-like serine/threonine-protein kinase